MSTITTLAGDVATLPAPTVASLTPAAMARALAAPFDPRDVKLKPQVVQGTRALAVTYVDARAVQDRLDAVFGVDGWSTKYTPLADGSVMCDLSCRFGDEWVTKGDVGSLSAQPDAGDRVKAAFSDALKRAAVHFGVARYLYRLGGQWLDYDPVKKQFRGTPRLTGPVALPSANGTKPSLTGKVSGPKQLPAATSTTPATPTADRRWQDLNASARQYAGLLAVPTDQVLRDLRRACHIDDDTPYAALSAEQWQCLEGKLRGAIQKRAGVEG
jgi:hypothetical protein